jgi:hypothetical protein
VDKDDEKTVQIGIKVPKWLRRRLKWLALRRDTSVAKLTREYWEKLVTDEPNGPEGEGDG